MKLKDLKTKKSYKVAGTVLSVVGLLVTFLGFISFQYASADITSYFKASDVGIVLIACGVVLVLGSIVTFVFLFMSE